MATALSIGLKIVGEAKWKQYSSVRTSDIVLWIGFVWTAFSFQFGRMTVLKSKTSKKGTVKSGDHSEVFRNASEFYWNQHWLTKRSGKSWGFSFWEKETCSCSSQSREEQSIPAGNMRLLVWALQEESKLIALLEQRSFGNLQSYQPEEVRVKQPKVFLWKVVVV